MMIKVRQMANGVVKCSDKMVVEIRRRSHQRRTRHGNLIEKSETELTEGRSSVGKMFCMYEFLDLINIMTLPSL